MGRDEQVATMIDINRLRELTAELGLTRPAGLVGAVLLRMEPSFDPFDDDWGSTLAAKRCEGCWTSPGGRA